MPAKVTKIVFHNKGFDAVRKSPEVTALVESEAQKLAQSHKGKYSVRTYKKRAGARIYCADEKTAQNNLDNNTLVKMAKGGKRK